jgi:stage V sporulation protein D (sporulation-specific penicillin-binding protein)
MNYTSFFNFRFPHVKIIFVGLFLLAMLFIAILRAYHLQIISGPTYRNLYSLQIKKSIAVPAERGAIYDREGNIYAYSEKVMSVFASPELHYTLTEDEREYLCNILSISAGDFKKTEDMEHFYWLKRNIDKDTAEKIRSFKRDNIWCIDEYKRVYPEKYSAAHVLRTAGIDNLLFGVESYFNDTLKGQDGIFACYRNAKGEPIPGYYTFNQQPTRGRDIKLTLSKQLQVFSEKEFNTFSSTNIKYGTIILIHPRSGEILALANYPFSEDLNSHTLNEDLLYESNVALNHSFTADNIFFLIVNIAALEKYWWDTNRLDFIKKRSRYYIINSDSKNKAIPQYFLSLLSEEELKKYIISYGLGSESSNQLDSDIPEHFSMPISSYTSERVFMTPLQVANIISIIYNDGAVIKPFISHSNTSSDSFANNKKRKKITSKATSSSVKQILIDNVNIGASKVVFLPNSKAGAVTINSRRQINDGSIYHLFAYAGFIEGNTSHESCIIFVMAESNNILTKEEISAVGKIYRNVSHEALRYLEQEF